MPQSYQPLRVSSTFSTLKEKSFNNQIFRVILKIASAALLVRVVGMLNQIVVTARFGGGATMDAYFVATSLPLLMAQLVIDAIEFSVIPVYARIRTQGTKEQVSVLFSSLLNLFLIGAALLTLFMLIFRRQIIFLSAPSLDPFRMGLAIDLSILIYPALLLMTVIGYLECILNTEGEFGWPAFAGLLVPLTTGILALIAWKSLGVAILCVGMLIGLCLQLSVMIIRARRARIIYRPVIDWRNSEVGPILIMAWPVLFGALINQASPFVDQIFASSLSAGSISALNYSLKLISVPVGVIFVSVGRAALPFLSRQVAMKDIKAFKETLRLYLWGTGIFTAVLTAFMIVLAHPLVELLFQHGTFSADDTNRTAYTMIGFAVGLIPMAFGFILAKAFSAISKTWVLMYVTFFSVIANALFDYILVRFWQSFGIALATSGVYVCTMIILLIILRRMIGKLDLLEIPSEIPVIVQKLVTVKYWTQWNTWKEK